MRLAFYCEYGSPSFRFLPEDIWTRGVGGAELSLISLAETLAARGHEVVVYHDPPEESDWHGVAFRQAHRFDWRDKLDAFILFRNPSDMLRFTHARRKVFWSTDQLTTGNYGTDVYPYVDVGVTISPYHRLDHLYRYPSVPPEKIIWIDLGVRLEDYQIALPKEEGKCIFSSVPHRGAQWLASFWPAVVKENPQARLVLTGDYSLWGRGYAAGVDDIEALYAFIPNAAFLGKIRRSELIRHQLTSDLMVYPHFSPNGMPELFCIACAEAQAAGALPITTSFGGLASTNTTGVQILGDPRQKDVQDSFVHTITSLLKDRPGLAIMQERARQQAFSRFDWRIIARKWESIFNGTTVQDLGTT